MLFLFGLITVIASVLIGYVGAHGQLLALWQPYEIVIILGAAIGAWMGGNNKFVIVNTFAVLGPGLFGHRGDKDTAMDMLSVIFKILNKSRKEGMMSIEADVENPQASPVFSAYPAVQANAPLADFIADYFRLIAAGNIAAHELDSLMDMEIDSRLHELEMPGTAMQTMADSLPGFGIVAAVLGIVITMGDIGGDAETIGLHVAAALVGTFFGVLSGYGIFAPIAGRLKHMAHDEIKLYEAAKAAIVASVNGMPPQLAAEFGRKVLYVHERPTFNELEQKLRGG